MGRPRSISCFVQATSTFFQPVIWHCRKAARVIFDLEDRPNEKSMRDIAAIWAPHRGTAARLLWAYYAVLKDGREILPL